MKDRAEFEQRNFDQVEEAKLHKHDCQMAFLNMRRSIYPGCPHRHGMPDYPDVCDANEMRVCVLETYPPQPCDLYGQYLEEWRLEYEASDKADAVRGLSESLQR